MMTRRLEIDASVAALHAQGWSDVDVAGSLGCARITVVRHRRALGLAPNGWNARNRRKVKVGLERVWRANGLSSLGEMKGLVFRLRTARMGYDPTLVSYREAQILELLREGPKTASELRQALGVRSLQNYRVPGGRYTAHLLRLGVIERKCRARPGLGSLPSLYELLPDRLGRVRLRSDEEARAEERKGDCG